MSKDRRTILFFAVFGVAIASLFFAYFKILFPTHSSGAVGALWAAILLCPGFLLFVWAAAIELDVPSLAIIWMITGLMNFVIYAGVGAAFVKLRKGREARLDF
jgi:hypothetical protein